jgi:hypothetical protein
VNFIHDQDAGPEGFQATSVRDGDLDAAALSALML